MNQNVSPENTNNNLTLPLLITRGLVVFPNMTEEIEAARPFSVQAVKDAKEMTNSLLFIVAQKSPDLDDPKEEDLYKVGTLCRIVSYAQNGSAIRLRVVGSQRVKFLKFALGEKPSAEGILLDPAFGDKQEEAELIKQLFSALSSTRSSAAGSRGAPSTSLGKAYPPMSFPTPSPATSPFPPSRSKPSWKRPPSARGCRSFWISFLPSANSPRSTGRSTRKSASPRRNPKRITISGRR